MILYYRENFQNKAVSKSTNIPILGKKGARIARWIRYDSTSFCFTKEKGAKPKTNTKKSSFLGLPGSRAIVPFIGRLMDCTCSNFRSSTAPLSWTPTSSSRLPQSLSLSKLKFRVPFGSLLPFRPLFFAFVFLYRGLFLFLQNLKRLNLIKHSMVVMSVSGSGENGSLDRFPLTPNKLFMQEVLNLRLSRVQND